MRILALAWFDPASVVLSHRNLMRAAGHDFRLAVVRAYTDKQREADYVCEQLVFERTPISLLAHTRRAFWEKLSPNREELREFAAQADVIQFHPGIGHGDGDWASQDGGIRPVGTECYETMASLGLENRDLAPSHREVYFVHGSRATWANRGELQTTAHDWGKWHGHRFATSTIDYAHELDAAYLPPLVDVGDLRARLRGDDDPLLIAHTPTDRIACSTTEFLKAAQGLGIPVRLGEGLKHADVLHLKAECNAGFDHLRGAFSTNTLENAALGLVPLFRLAAEYLARYDREGLSHPTGITNNNGIRDLSSMLRHLSADPAFTREMQLSARRWWETYFSAEPITKRLLKFYEGL